MTTDNYLMSPADLIKITGKKRYIKQADWFKQRFGLDVNRRDDGSIVIAWATFLALDAKKAGVGAPAALQRAPIHSPFA